MANEQPTVYVSSYSKGGIMESMQAGKIAEVLAELHVDVTEAELDLTDVEGNERKATPASVLRDGDTLVIMRKKNKSGK